MSETKGEQFKRLQMALSGGRANPSERLAFATVCHNPAFADYVLGLESQLTAALARAELAVRERDELRKVTT
jgi:hypothetical protein